VSAKTKPCTACGKVVRKATRALIVPGGKYALVCADCAGRGVLVVAQLLTMRIKRVRTSRPGAFLVVHRDRLPDGRFQ
jgi:hypothetical protein